LEAHAHPPRNLANWLSRPEHDLVDKTKLKSNSSFLLLPESGTCCNAFFWTVRKMMAAI
jgi:hypothetical protein